MDIINCMCAAWPITPEEKYGVSIVTFCLVVQSEKRKKMRGWRERKEEEEQMEVCRVDGVV